MIDLVKQRRVEGSSLPGLDGSCSTEEGWFPSCTSYTSRIRILDCYPKAQTTLQNQPAESKYSFPDKAKFLSFLLTIINLKVVTENRNIVLTYVSLMIAIVYAISFG